LRDSICGYIRIGAYIETAAIIAGISKETFYDWLKKGAKAKSRRESIHRTGGEFITDDETQAFIDFSDAVERATHESEMSDIVTIKKASEKNWQAAWRLERKFPKKWGRQDHVEQTVTGPDGGPVQVQQTTIPLPADAIDKAYKDKVRREVERELATSK
jgi:transposase